MSIETLCMFMLCLCCQQVHVVKGFSMLQAYNKHLPDVSRRIRNQLISIENISIYM